MKSLKSLMANHPLRAISTKIKNNAKYFALAPNTLKENIILEILTSLVIMICAGIALVFGALFIYLLLVKATVYFIVFLLLIILTTLGFYLYHSYGKYLLKKDNHD